MGSWKCRQPRRRLGAVSGLAAGGRTAPPPAARPVARLPEEGHGPLPPGAVTALPPDRRGSRAVRGALRRDHVSPLTCACVLCGASNPGSGLVGETARWRSPAILRALPRLAKARQYTFVINRSGRAAALPG